MKRPVAWLHFFPDLATVGGINDGREWLLERPNGMRLRQWAWSFRHERLAIAAAERRGWDLVLVDFTGPVPNHDAWKHPTS